VKRTVIAAAILALGAAGAGVSLADPPSNSGNPGDYGLCNAYYQGNGDGQGKGKLTGFMRKVAQEDLRAFCMLLGRIIPLQVEQKTIDDRPKRTTYKSVEEVKRELASRGIDMEIMFKIMQADPTPMDDGDEPESLDADPEP